MSSQKKRRHEPEVSFRNTSDDKTHHQVHTRRAFCRHNLLLFRLSNSRIQHSRAHYTGKAEAFRPITQLNQHTCNTLDCLYITWPSTFPSYPNRRFFIFTLPFFCPLSSSAVQRDPICTCDPGLHQAESTSFVTLKTRVLASSRHNTTCF